MTLQAKNQLVITQQTPPKENNQPITPKNNQLQRKKPQLKNLKLHHSSVLPKTWFHSTQAPRVAKKSLMNWDNKSLTDKLHKMKLSSPSSTSTTKPEKQEKMLKISGKPGTPQTELKSEKTSTTSLNKVENSSVNSETKLLSKSNPSQQPSAGTTMPQIGGTEETLPTMALPMPPSCCKVSLP